MEKYTAMVSDSTSFPSREDAREDDAKRLVHTTVKPVFVAKPNGVAESWSRGT